MLINQHGGDPILNSHITHFFMLLSIPIFMLSSCKDPEMEKKIDARLRLQIKTLKESSQLDKNISIVFKTNMPLTDLHKSVLQKKCIKIIANIGHIYTAKLPARFLYDLAKMKFVESIQGSREFNAHPVDSLKQIRKF